MPSKKAILIGFNYKRSGRRQPLLGIIIDLYRMYKYCLRKNYDIKVITDFDIDEDREDFIQALIDETIDTGIIEFSEALAPIEGKEIPFLIQQELDGEQAMLVYYSGHFINNYFILSDNQEMSIKSFNSLVYNSLDSSCQLFLILDCCCSKDVQDCYRLVINDKKMIYESFAHNYPRIHSITLTPNTDKVPMDSNGTSFTRDVVNYFRKRTSDSLKSLVLTMNEHKQPVIINTSMFKQDYLFTWI